MSKEFKIGLLALVASVLLYTGFNFLKGMDFFSRINHYYVVFKNVNGLTISNPVMLNGLAVGRVSNIEVMQADSNKMKVEVQIRTDLILGKGSKIILGDNGLLGGKMLDLKISNEKPLIANGGDLTGEIQVGMVASLTAKADPIIAQTDSMLRQVNLIVKSLADSRQDLTKTLSDVSDISGSVNSTLKKGELDQIVHNMNVLSASLIDLQKQFSPVVGKMDTFADKMNKMEIDASIKKANEAMTNLNTILDGVNQGKGTLGALAKNDSLYRNMNKNLQDLDKIFLDLRENPKRYVNISVFPKKEKKQ
jgi:phospholipid/cholesterol/gamma-HCH transport system substrate-binding protein